MPIMLLTQIFITKSVLCAIIIQSHLANCNAPAGFGLYHVKILLPLRLEYI